MSIQERRPADNYGSVERPHLEQPSRKCCKIKYRVRYFYSKGAFLVLLWTALISTTVSPFCDDLFTNLKKMQNYYYGFFLLIPLVICLPLIGWLADAKFGNYKVFKAGAVLMFTAAVVNNTSSLLTENKIITEGIVALQIIIILSCFVGVIGTATCLLTALQLGLDQMPDAAAANITSFIAWFITALFGGIWVYATVTSVLTDCVQEDRVSQIIVILLPTVCMTVVCCTLFVFGPRCLIIEPKSPRALRTIFQVLKFAAKHKAPLNRSAFTYWEEDIPSRLDLGKSKYGGPFTIEQVEDVKTFFKILTILGPIFIIGLVLSMDINIERSYHISCSSTSKLWASYVFNSWWSVIPLYEFGLFPLIRYLLPSILKRIGTISLLIFVVKCSYLATSVVDFIHSQPTNNTETDPVILYPIDHDFWVNMAISFASGSMAMFLTTAVLEFVCAQSPYNMRGLLTGFSTLLSLLSLALLAVANDLVPEAYIITRNSIITALSLVGFILYCVLAHWYKRRVRDEDYSPHRVVEEVYDRYLSNVPPPPKIYNP